MGDDVSKRSVNQSRKRAAKAWQAEHGCSYQQALQAVDGKRRAPATEHRATTGSGKTFALAHAVQRRMLEKQAMADEATRLMPTAFSWFDERTHLEATRPIHIGTRPLGECL